jgi:23S rRNA (cytosine1962-C5)-methyltransferase
MAQLILLPGKERSLFKHHPWLFAGSVDHLDGRARPGDTVEVVSDKGKPLARAAWSPASQIRARVWSLDPTESIDHGFFKRRVAAAVNRRSALPGLGEQAGLRLIHAESDGLPGVVVDRYRDAQHGTTLVMQLTSAGADKWRDALIDALRLATDCERIYERSDSDVRALEGLEPTIGWRHGEMPEGGISIIENGVRMAVDVVNGHKTGFYLDQRDNRLLLSRLSPDKRVLNCFCYTAGFSLQALAGGASEVVSVDSSGPALAIAAHNLALNPQLDANRAQWREADVFTDLRELRKAGELFDIVVLDPPKFAPSASHADRAAKAYKDININGIKLLAPGGFLMTYSCSGGVGLELFQKIVAGAARDAGRTARIVQRLQGSADHPVDLAFPEGEYLKGLLLQVD